MDTHSVKREANGVATAVADATNTDKIATVGSTDSARATIEKAVSSATTQATEALQTLVGKSEDQAGKVVAAAEQAADAGLHKAAVKAEALAHTIRERGSGAGGPVADVAAVAADTFERSGAYLSETDVRTLIDKSQGVIARNKQLTIIGGVVLAFLLVLIVIRLMRGSDE